MKKLFCLVVAVMLIFLFVIAGCGTKTPASSETQQPQASKTPEATKVADTTKAPEATTAVVEYKESPYFAGKGLPPVKDRLPKEPKITNEMPENQLKYEVGTYGGTLHVISSNIGWSTVVFLGNQEPLLNTPGLLGKTITPNVLKGYEMSADQKEFTLHMREGLKWSDGTSVTAKDVQFAIEDVLFNKELTPILPGWACSGGNVSGTPLKFTLVDDFTFKFTFDKPYGGFSLLMAVKDWGGYTDFLKPSSYLKEFHKKYADAAVLETEIKAAKFKPGEWINLFNDKDILNWELANPKSIGFPCLQPWIYTKKTETTDEFERNPYYFKVDSDGNQLPYIDKIVSTFVQDLEVGTMKIISGEVDLERESASLNKMPLYKANEAKSGYKVYFAGSHSTPADIFLNLTFKNDNWRKVVRDERFRKALNLGINRKEIVDTLYFGFIGPSTIEDATYDVAAANKLLDEMGMTKGTDGFRKGPDGKKFTIPFEVATLLPDTIPLTQLFVEQWKALGLDVTMKTIDRTLLDTRNAANELQATAFFTFSPLWYMKDWGQGYWAPLWNSYFNSAGKKGEKPPADVQKLYDLIAKTTTVKPEEGIIAADGIKAELKAHNWYFIPVPDVKQPFIANAKLGNISDKGFSTAIEVSLEQLFFKK